MNVSDLPLLAPALAAGIGLGIFYFCGLWLTVRKLPTARRPLVLSLGSFLARLAVVLVGFYFVMDGRWDRLVVCLLGFIGVRAVLLKIWGPGKKNRRSHAEPRVNKGPDGARWGG